MLVGFKKRKRPGESSTSTTTLPTDAHTGPAQASDDGALKEGRGSDALAYYADYDTPTAYPVKLPSHTVAPATSKSAVTTTDIAPLNHSVAESKIVEEKVDSDDQVIAVTHHRRSALPPPPPPPNPPPQINAESSSSKHSITTDSGIAGIDPTACKVKSVIHMRVNPSSAAVGGGGVRGTVRKPTGFIQVDEEDE